MGTRRLPLHFRSVGLLVICTGGTRPVINTGCRRLMGQTRQLVSAGRWRHDASPRHRRFSSYRDIDISDTGVYGEFMKSSSRASLRIRRAPKREKILPRLIVRLYITKDATSLNIISALMIASLAIHGRSIEAHIFPGRMGQSKCTGITARNTNLMTR